MDKLTQQKFKTINRLLLDDHVLVHVDSNAQGVDLPSHLMKNQAVILKLSKLFRGALTVLEDKITTDLLFDFGYYTCHVPLSAVWGATSDKGKSTIWPESVPENLLKEMMASGSGLALAESGPSKERAPIAQAARPVAAMREPAEPPSAGPSSTEDKRSRSGGGRKISHLRRVK